MPWRLILVILIFVVFLVFIFFNLGEDYRSHIHFVFTKTKEPVPVFFTIFASFALGVLITLPVALGSKKKDARLKDKSNKNKKDDYAGAGEKSDEAPPSNADGKLIDKNIRDGKK